MGYSKKGIAFELINIFNKSSNQSCTYGFGCNGYGYTYPIEKFEIKSSGNIKNQLLPKTFSFKINQKLYEVKTLDHSENGICMLSINGHIGGAILMKDIHKSEPDMLGELLSLKSFAMNSKIMSDKLVISLEEDICSNTDMSGGKGSSLALLKKLQKEINSFEVPKGFVITTNSFNLLIKENQEIEKEIEKLQQNIWSENKTNLNEQCLKVLDLFSNKKIPEVIRIEIEKEFKYLDENSIQFAVRSSALGEDSENMSFAGQMTTILGVRGIDAICEAIMKCWSSQFSMTAIEYKRNYGQLISTPMAVVVQALIDCDVSGVLFTCDPITADQIKLVINSNYGIGESVVSGVVNPDTTILSVGIKSNNIYEKRSINSIENVIIGDKENFIKADDRSGTKCLINDKSNTEDCCLTNEEAIRLGQIGLSVQSYYGSVRDIEWGIKDGIIYLFQSRPITNFELYSDWELSHELDDGHNDENEYMTKANAGDVFPGSVSHLCLSTTMRQINLTNGRMFCIVKGLTPIPLKHLGNTTRQIRNSLFLCMKDGGLFDFANQSYFHKSNVIALFGHTVDDKQLQNDCIDRLEETSYFHRLKTLYQMFNYFISFNKRHTKLLDMYSKNDLSEGIVFKTSNEMAIHLDNKFMNVSKTFVLHLYKSAISGIYNFLLLAILSKGKFDLNSNKCLLKDFADILSSIKNLKNTIISADIPLAINQLVLGIKKSKYQQFFVTEPENALKILENDTEECGQMFRNFITTYGHRCGSEFDYLSESWRENPLPIIETIQAIGREQNEQQISSQSCDSEQILNKIKTPINWLFRYVLKNFVIPKCHEMIASREKSKSDTIYIIDKQKQFIRKMAKLMTHKEGRIPDENLIYFMTWDEINRLTQYRDSKIIVKAKQRRKLHKTLNEFVYEEIVIGPEVKPINFDNNSIEREKYMNGNNLVIRGTPISTGIIEGKVCVVKNFSEVKNIQSGDILCTYSTDISWSPYFPLLSGIITEIGGLVSHGAVIAREYGLPSIVGVNKVCQLLRTGDRILLNADEGLIVLIK